MRQMLYIDIDEEMIAVIGRLRKSPARENALVAPKRALILQSIVNLRLLRREAEKLGKNVVLVTQDEQGRALAGKAGLEVQSSVEEDKGAEIPEEVPVVAAPPRPEPVPEPDPKKERAVREVRLPRSDAVGSPSFFAAASPLPSVGMPSRPASPEPLPVPAKAVRATEGKKIAVHDRSPRYLTALNSKTSQEEALSVGQEASLSSLNRPRDISTSPQGLVEPYGTTPKLPSYFHPDGSPAERKAAGPSGHSAGSVPVRVPGSHRLKGAFLFFGLVSLLSLAGVGAYLFLPKAEVVVKLKSSVQKSDFDFRAQEGAVVSSEARTLPARTIEREGEVLLSFDATGKSSLADQKARGTVVIYNEYGSEPQALVASTRLLSQDGKLFRLANGVTVPGMATVDGKAEPGAVEAAVIADQPGAEYNIGPSSFTVPGFEGSPKHAKFSAKSLKIMSGGGRGGSDVPSVSEEDVQKAKRASEAQVAAKGVELAAAEAQEAGEKLLDEAVETTVLSSSASPQAGTVADTFEYRVRFKVRALAFSEQDLARAVKEDFENQNAGRQPELFVEKIDLQYGEPSPDFASRTLKVKVHGVAALEPKLDLSRLRDQLLGKKEDDIAGVLREYPQVEKVTLNFWPEFLTSQIPSESGRVTIRFEGGEPVGNTSNRTGDPAAY
jgi:hypothetical protein